MDLKSSLVIGVCVIIAGVALSLTLSLRAPSQPPAQEPPSGRFQIAGNPGHAFVLDTATGQVWENFEPEGMGGSDAGFMPAKPRNK